MKVIVFTLCLTTAVLGGYVGDYSAQAPAPRPSYPAPAPAPEPASAPRPSYPAPAREPAPAPAPSYQAPAPRPSYPAPQPAPVPAPKPDNAGHDVVDKCTCHEKGNYYSPVSADGCRSFTQRTAFLPAKTLHCPSNLMFDVNVCVCNYPENVECPRDCQDYDGEKPSSDFCEQRGNYYKPVPGTKCSQFTQATDLLPAQKHNCPAGLQFNLAVCVCDWPWRTQCNV